MSRRSQAKPQGSHLAPEPEGPEEVYRRFERLNRRGASRNLREIASGSGKKTLYGAFAAVEVTAVVLGFVLEVPYLDTVAIALPGLLVLLRNGSGNAGADQPVDEPGEETFLERLLRRFGDPDSTGGGPADG